MAAQANRAYVQVANHNFYDVDVYAVRFGMKLRLGSVTSDRTRRFAPPPSIVATGEDVRLMVQPIGSPGDYTTSPIMISPGQTVQWTVENVLPMSS